MSLFLFNHFVHNIPILLYFTGQLKDFRKLTPSQHLKAEIDNRVKMISEKVIFSVVIPSFNAKKTICQTLNAILNQRTDYKYEVIVVDSSNDGTQELIAQKYPQVRLLRLKNQTLPGSGRNLGIRSARGKYIAFTDADCIPEMDWLQRIAKNFQEINTDAVGGCLINGYPSSITAWVSHLIEFNEWTETTPAGYMTNIPSANLAYKKTTFYRLGVQFTDVFPSEDTIFNWTMYQKGAKIYFDPKIKVVHLNRVVLRKLLQHQYWLGLASAEARRSTTLPGHIFVRHPILGVGLPAIRWIRTFGRLLQKDIHKLCIFIAVTPFYLIAAIAWSLGFVRQGNFSVAIFTLKSKKMLTKTDDPENKNDRISKRGFK